MFERNDLQVCEVAPGRCYESSLQVVAAKQIISDRFNYLTDSGISKGAKMFVNINSKKHPYQQTTDYSFELRLSAVVKVDKKNFKPS